MNIIEQKLRDYHPKNALEQEAALTEIVQQIVLFGLSRSGFFTEAAFHGGTCLRILYGLRRFSEDLDFALKKPASDFSWEALLPSVLAECNAFGLELELKDRQKASTAVKSAFLKTDSIGKVLQISLPFSRHKSQKLVVKVEIDTNPPAGATYESRFLLFPGPASITTMDLSSSFSGKLHALLCRSYVKGRDWYDLLWYLEHRVSPNIILLGKALTQVGPWKDGPSQIDIEWVRNQLSDKIRSLDWKSVQRDISRFIPANEQKNLTLWGTDLFIDALNRSEIFKK
jgi:predicted nucleotidyltransferase component of viral defense system